MMEKNAENLFKQRIKEAFDHKVSNLSTDTLQEIHNRRKLALQKRTLKTYFWQSLRNNSFGSLFQWNLGSGFVAASVVIVVLFFASSPIQENLFLSIDDDIEQLALTSNEIELSEKLEFYLWLQEFSEEHEIHS